MKNKNDFFPPDQIETARRDFFKLVSGSLAVFAGLVLGIPLMDALVGPALRTRKRAFAKVAKVEALPTGEPVDLTFAAPTTDAYLQETDLRSIWAVKHSPSEVVVFSAICPHLGCQYRWNAQSQHFVCPCHGSVFALDGQVVAGPAPRALDTLPQKIQNRELFVEWERFKLGIPDKVPV